MKKTICLFSLLLMFATDAFAKQVQLNFDYPVSVARPADDGLKEKTEFKQGETVSLESSTPYFIQSRGRIPLLIVPMSNTIDETLKLNLPTVPEWPPVKTDSEMDRVLSSMMNLMTQFQTALSQKRIEDAEQLLTQMTALRDLPTLHFFRAYLQFAKGNVSQAKSSVQQGLERHPAHDAGQQLLKTIEGGN